VQRFASVAVLTVVLAVAVVLLLLVNEAGASPSKRLSRFQIEVQSTVVAAYQDPTLIRPLMQRDHITMMLMPEMAEFADAIEHRRAPGITASDGRRVLRVLDAVIASGRSRKAVAVGAPILAAY
jgi:hypothetical protein